VRYLSKKPPNLGGFKSRRAWRLIFFLDGRPSGRSKTAQLIGRKIVRLDPFRQQHQLDFLNFGFHEFPNGSGDGFPAEFVTVQDQLTDRNPKERISA
jgi:hypothetical protein